MSELHRLLVISYFFPPIGGAGIERTLKHVTYLPAHGWEPVVVAPSNSAYRIIDPALLARVPPGLEVRRAPTLEPAHLRQLARSVLGRPSAATTARAGPAGRTAPPTTHGGGLREMANALWARLIPRVFFPDEHILWAPGAIAEGWSAHRSRPVDAIYSSSPPITAHLVAAALRPVLGVPWIADFRDPWIGNAFARPLPAAHRALQVELERTIVTAAARSTFPTEPLRDAYSARYPRQADRLVHIPNGYDLADLADVGDAASTSDLGEAAEPGTFRIVYSGSIYEPGDLSLLLDGLELALERRPELRGRLRVELVGWLSAETQPIADARIPRLGPVVRHLGQRPRSEALARTRRADAGLLLIGPAVGRELFIGTKLYEYLGADRQVLAVAPRGAASAVLDNLDWGVVAEPTPVGVANGIDRLLAGGLRSGVADPERRYERRTLAGLLAGQLDEVVSA